MIELYHSIAREGEKPINQVLSIVHGCLLDRRRTVRGPKSSPSFSADFRMIACACTFHSTSLASQALVMSLTQPSLTAARPDRHDRRGLRRWDGMVQSPTESSL